MAAEPAVTHVESERRRRGIWRLIAVSVVALLLLLGLVVASVALVLGVGLARNNTMTYPDNVAHFEHGSIGADQSSGIPYWIWQALPRLFPEAFGGRLDYQRFGFLYRTDAQGRQDDLPIGISKRNFQGVDLVWFNCAVCHAGSYRATDGGERTIVPGMPANNLDLYAFIKFVLEAGADERLSAEALFPAMQQAGARFGVLDRLKWQYLVLPLTREGLLQRRSRLIDFVNGQQPWGPGRVDTFNPYKLFQMKVGLTTLTADERQGATDFPAIFNQKPRGDRKMELHWDGNNSSLAERNLSAAIGAGVTAETADHKAIERIADWLGTLKPPESPHRPDAAAVARGRTTFAAACAGCHGYQGERDYVFDGARLGKVEPITAIGTDPGRLNSYTDAFRKRQLSELFAGTPYQFKFFVKTDGYANLPLDGLWLRGPYLHNGSVPTLRDLLARPADRPKAFVRGLDVIDGRNGGFQSRGCNPGERPPQGFCYDTGIPGNGNQGHEYGTNLTSAEKDDLLAYLLTF